MSKPNSNASPHIALIAVQVMFATWPVFGKVVLRTIPSLGLVGIRVLGAAVALTAIGLATADSSGLRDQIGSARGLEPAWRRIESMAVCEGFVANYRR